MSRHVAVPARTPRAVETESGEADPAAAARIGAAAMADEPTCWSVHAAHGALPSPTALRSRAAAPAGVASLVRHDAVDLFSHAVAVRHAVEADQAAIVALVRSEHLNPTDLDWRRFVVASDGVSLVGAAQLRANHGGSHELSSLVVRPHARGRGLATRMIELLTFDRRERLYAITRRSNVARFARWGFVEIDARDAAREVRRRRLIGQIASIVSLLRARRPARLVVLERVPPTAAGLDRQSERRTTRQTRRIGRRRFRASRSRRAACRRPWQTPAA